MKKKQQLQRNQTMKQLSELVLEGFLSKFQKLEVDRNKKAAIIKIMLEEEQNELILLGEEQLWGVLSLKNSNTAHAFPRLPYILSWGNRLKLLFILWGFNHQVKENETYIDFIVVKNEFRSHGIGSTLIKIAQEKLKKSDSLTLYVAANNLRAKKLYEKHGFIVKRTDYSFIRKLFFGVGKWYFMEWKGSK